MATTRRRRASGIRSLRANDLYGKATFAGSAELVTDRRVRRITRGRNAFEHRAKNGINDPYTFFHLVENLLCIEPGFPFKASQFTTWLNEQDAPISWDAVTVGRVLNDILDNIADITAEGKLPFSRLRDHSGVYYEIETSIQGRAILFRLLDDLYVICEEMRKDELAGEFSRRQDSPLLRCPSLMDPVREMAEDLAVA
jgi:hypothetical protein